LAAYMKNREKTVCIIMSGMKIALNSPYLT